MAQARRRGINAGSKLAVLLMGEVGTKKSEYALETTLLKRPDGKPFRVLYIDIENGSIDDRLTRPRWTDKIDERNIWVVYTQSMDEVLEFIRQATDGDDFYEIDDNGDETDVVVLDAEGAPFRPDAIVLDGLKLLTDAGKMALLETGKKRAEVRIADKQITGNKAKVLRGNVKLEPSDYQISNNNGIKLISKLVGCGKHFVVTTFAKDEAFDDETGAVDNFGNVKKIKTGRSIPDAFKGFNEYCKTVISLTKDQFGDVTATIQGKDRTETFVPEETVQDFSLTMLQSAVDNSAGGITIKSKLSEAIDKDANTLLSGKEASKPKVETPKEDSVESLQAEIMNLITKDGTTLSKSRIGSLKSQGFGNVKKETDLEKLQEMKIAVQKMQ